MCGDVPGIEKPCVWRCARNRETLCVEMCQEWRDPVCGDVLWFDYNTIDVSDGSEDEVKEGGAGGPHESPLAVLQMKLNELTIAYELVVKNSDQIATNRLESGETQVLLKITSSAMVKVRRRRDSTICA